MQDISSKKSKKGSKSKAEMTKDELSLQEMQQRAADQQAKAKAAQEQLAKEMEKQQELLEKTKRLAEEQAKAQREVEIAQKELDDSQKDMEDASKRIDAASGELSKLGQMTEAEMKEKESQKYKIDRVFAKCDKKKEASAELIKLGQYGEAVKGYKEAADVLESAGEDFPLYKQEIAQYEASVFNNIAVCCKKELNSKSEVEWTSKVIERAEYISDSNVVLKAFLRRGLAYEQLEKFLQAKEDMLSVK